MLCAGDKIRARSHSRAALRLSNDSMLRLDQKTSLSFAEIQTDSSTSLLDLLEGAIHIITRTPKPFRIRTPFANASVEGTEFFVGLEHHTAKVVVYEGKVLVSNEAGSIHLHDHEAALALNGQAPRKEIVIRPTDAVHWALHYPVISNDWRTNPSKSDQSADGLVRQASRLLIVGQADEASAIIEQALKLEPGNSDAYALLAIIAVTQNEKDQALELATQAVAASEQRSGAAYLALSYAQQAHFDIDAALESVQKALALDAENALIWARLAELRMSVGDLDRALEAAQHAVTINAEVAKTHVVLGFAHLLQINIRSAKTTFMQAIALDQADPMPRLGLGIALIRQGELEAGRVELEIAASLDPANSLIRSYLGKAYFEEKRYLLARTQFDLAKERDPKDPTPWFYDAIQKQTQNRPVEALRDIQKSIELNDNRAVYRSKFLLDRDEAARGSSLARIFENLGFERRAIMETAKSLSFDPANHSAHRFLSDTYANTPRYEIARVSELLQAQLLQPINVNPVQPHMAVADLNIITNTGPSSIGFNEFTPLMERNKSQVVASGIVGNNSTLGNEIVLSKLYKRTSISFGQFHYETKGFRANNDQNHNIYNAFIQHAFTPKFNVQAEVRSRATEHGDLLLDFGPKTFKNYRREINEIIARVGAKYSLSYKQDFLFSGKYVNRSEDYGQTALNNEGYQIEIQHLFREKYFNSVIGGGTYQYSWINKPNQTDSFKNMERNNAYIYTNFNLPRNINFTLGLGHDSFTSTIDGKNKDKLNPKLGLQWNLGDSFRLRAAWFETTKSHLIAQQSLEPTQVVGFNQFYDDPNGARARRMGIGLDFHYLNKIYSGIEISQRRLIVPTIIQEVEQEHDLKREHLQPQSEHLLQAYLYWLPGHYWAIRSEPRVERFKRDINDERLAQGFNGAKEPVRIHTLSVPFSIEYFLPTGFFSSFTTTFITQDLIRRQDALNTNQERIPGKTNSGVDSFFLFDAVIGYRFPNRRGIISLEGRNLLNEKFYYRNIGFYQSEAISPRFIPERTIFARLMLNF
ncbi:FecR domain-containing protein [Nitrosomonas sp. JL21]|uniref:FecR domain-containing protein n=1 Tax=Nitrosomonas sp. JL21 TaxID=153949 RepID=UPI0023DAF399|nr:FecR domain-containing protein [Nitrosomonas sp. JL21]